VLLLPLLLLVLLLLEIRIGLAFGRM